MLRPSVSAAKHALMLFSLMALQAACQLLKSLIKGTEVHEIAALDVQAGHPCQHPCRIAVQELGLPDLHKLTRVVKAQEAPCMQEAPVHGPSASSSRSAGSCPVVHTQPAHLCVEGSVCDDSIIGQDAHLHLQHEWASSHTHRVPSRSASR